MVTILFASLFGVALVLLPFFFQAGGEGRFRRGVGWYFDARTSRDVLMKQRTASVEGHQEGASGREIKLWLVAGIGLLALAVVTWVPFGIYGLSVIIGLFALVYFLRAFQAWRENRWLRGPKPLT
jgi:hypothetical protein